MSLSTKNGNDCIQTPDDLALAIVRHFQPRGRCLEPCHGGGAFIRALQDYNATFQPEKVITRIDCLDIAPQDGGPQGDFLALPEPERKADWIITNPPWSKFLAFLDQGMRHAHNVVFLDKMNAWTGEARLRMVENRWYAIREICLIRQPPKPWPQMGFQLAAVHISPATEAERKYWEDQGRRCFLGNPIITRLAYTPPKKTKIKLPPPSLTP